MRALSRLTLLVGSAASLAPAAFAAAQSGKPVVAVPSFENNSIGRDSPDYDGLGKGIADLLITDMASNAKIRLVDRERIQTVLQEQNLVKAGGVDAQTAVRVGRMLGAQYAVVGGFMNANGTMVLTARTIDIETSETANPQKVQATGDDVLALVAQLSTKLNKDVKLEVKDGQRMSKAAASPAGDDHASPMRADAPAATVAARTETFAKPLPASRHAGAVKLDLAAARIYAEALDEMDKRNPAKAATLLREVIARFPGFLPAKNNLEKLGKSGN